MPFDPVYPTFGLIAALIVMIPLPWHIRVGNTGTIMLMMWLCVANLNYFINSVVWFDSAENFAPIWCDISTKIIVAQNMALPCCNLVISKTLESIASTRQASYTLSDKRFRLVMDLSLGIGLPVIYTVLSIISQGHRFDVYYGFGCFPSHYNTPLYIVFYIVPAFVAQLVSLVYSVLAFRWFYIRRRQFNAVLASSGSGLDRSRYLRMMALTMIDTLYGLPVGIAALVIQAIILKDKIHPWKSWQDTHYDFGRVISVGEDDMKAAPIISQAFDLGRWSGVVGSLFFIVLFGFTKEARSEYVAWWSRGKKMVQWTFVKIGKKEAPTASRGQHREGSTPASVEKGMALSNIRDVPIINTSGFAAQDDIELREDLKNPDTLPQTPSSTFDPTSPQCMTPFQRHNSNDYNWTATHRGETLYSGVERIPSSTSMSSRVEVFVERFSARD